MTMRMPRPLRAGLPALTAIVLAAACTAPTPSGSPSAAFPSEPPVSSIVPSASTAIASVTPTATAAPTAAPTTAPTSAPTEVPPGPSAGAACPVEPQDGQLPSDRLVDVKIGSGADADVVTFVFGDASIGSPAGVPMGSLFVPDPPFSQAGSGQEIDLHGDHVVAVRFEHLSLQNDVGQPSYDGPLAFQPKLPVVTDVVNDDMSEGIVRWLIAYDGGGCVTLSRQGNDVSVAIAHAPG
jgi:hypothetical protein